MSSRARNRERNAIPQQVEHLQCRSSSPAEFRNTSLIGLEKIAHRYRRTRCLTSDHFHADEVKTQPALPVAMRPDPLQRFIVFAALLTEIQTQIEKRLRKHAIDHKQQVDQEPANSPIPVQERVDCLEL